VPETTTERVVFAVGLAVVAALVFLIVAGRNPSGSTAPRVRTGTVSTSTGAPTTTALPTTTSPTALAPAGRQQARLRLTAQADTWRSGHRDSPSGDLLFEGTLAAGNTKTFAGTAFGVRFGSAANVVASVNGKTLSLPSGTYSATITSAGLGRRSS
jgi:hypothetical protein